MLKFLEIKNIVLIDKAEIDFDFKKINVNHGGLYVFSGETGSGKSILLDALGLAIGFRSSVRLIGSDDSKASITAEFEISSNETCKNILKQNDLIDDENVNKLRIRRIINDNTSNKIYVNDIAVGASLLAMIGDSIAELHGQHDQRGLLNPSFHEKILDDFAKNGALLSEIKNLYINLKELDQEILEFNEKKNQAIREKDYLEFIIKELENADVKNSEEERLLSKKEAIIARGKINNFLNDIKSNLFESSSYLNLSQRSLIKNNNLINNYLKEDLKEFTSLSEKIDSFIEEIDKEIDKIEIVKKDRSHEEYSLEEVESRIFLIKNLSRKFNVAADELPNILKEAKDKLSLIDQGNENANKILQKRNIVLEKYNNKAANLSSKRKEMAIILSHRVEEELKFLKMENVKFFVDVKQNSQSEYGLTGSDKVKFYAAINNGDLDEITKIASGGELSRFMLALKVALIDVKSVPIVIFDEIDTGIGGYTADAVGKRLKTLSKNIQVFVVTHQAQIASKADVNFKISKIKDNKKIKTIIEKLNEDDKNLEIARMISGEVVSEESLAAAKKLITN